MGMVGLRGDVLLVAPASSFHHHPHDSIISDHHPINNSNAATALGVGVIPLLTAAPCLPTSNIGVDDGHNNMNDNRSRGGGGIQFWQNQQSYLKKSMVIDQNNSGNLPNTGSSGGMGGTATCQDCGNQAKKDCSHHRCRTCCKSRGFDCTTHVKSTWVPAARRRERQLVVAGSSGSTSALKKPRLLTSQTSTASHTSTSNTTPPRSFDTSSSHQDAGFRESLPRQVHAPAVFKCVRVTPVVDEGEDEYAYQAVVKIHGHVFKGLLYHQGVDGGDGIPNISDLHLGGNNGGNGRTWASSSPPIIDPPDVYAASSAGLLGGTAYGNPIN